MNRIFAGRIVGVLVVVGAALLPASVAFAGTTTPTDSYATGYVGLCGKSGQNVTSGSIYAKPFVWRAVSSQSAPQPFNSPGRKATLYAYQPRPGVDASQWSGNLLTAATAYTNAAVPMVQSNYRDFALSDFLNEYPPQLDGIVELRVEYSSSDTGYSTNYAASFVQVTGTTWHLLNGGSVNCSAGTATSPEARLPRYDKAGLQPPQLLSAVAAKAVGAPTGRAANLDARDVALGKKVPASDSTDAGAANRTAPAAAGALSPTSAPSAVADSTSSVSPGGNSHVALIASLVIALVLIGGAGFWWQHPRRTGASQH